MDKDCNPKHDGGGLPPSGRFASFNVKPEPGQGVFSPDFCMFSHDLSRMPDNPPKNIGHRRAHSEILTLPDDISFESDLNVVGGGDGPSLSDETEEDLFSMYLDMDKVNTSSATSTTQVGLPPQSSGEGPGMVGQGSSERPRIRHRHSQSMDGSTSIKSEMLVSGGVESLSADAKKAMSAAKLAELALIDPKRAKRIWANRQSAARSKERKMRYIGELERKLQSLQTEATSLSAQLTLIQRDTNILNAGNNELKLQLQTMEQQVHLQDALNNALKEEIHHLKILTGQAMPNSGSPMMNFPASSFGSNQAFCSNNNNQANMHTLLTAHQFQQLQIQSQKQHQFEQQHQFQQMHQQEQHVGDLRFRGPLPFASQRENTSDLKAPRKD
ncbi:hypothetical protein V2J09_011357 [Rumex salicifolius]